LKVLVEAESKGLEIVRRGPVFKLIIPAVDQLFAIGHGTDGILPLITAGQHAAFDDAAAGKADEAGVQPGEGLNQIRPKTTGTVFPSMLWKQGYEVDIDGAQIFEDDGQAGMGVGVIGSEGGRILFPVATEIMQSGSGEEGAVVAIRSRRTVGEPEMARSWAEKW